MPQDVWEAATLAADFIETEVTDLLDWDSRAGITMMVATVILAERLKEREACALVSSSLADDLQASAYEMRGNMRDYRLHRAAGIRHLVDILRKPEAYDERLQAIRSRP
jgi:hypothetical protein